MENCGFSKGNNTKEENSMLNLQSKEDNKSLSED